MFEGIKITDILTSVGTVGAVILSLCMAIKNDRKKAIVTHSRAMTKKVTDNGTRSYGIDRVCFYNKGQRKIHLRKLVIYRKKSFNSEKVYNIDYNFITEFDKLVESDSIIIVDVDFTFDNELQTLMGQDVTKLNNVRVVFEDIEGKKYKGSFKLHLFKKKHETFMGKLRMHMYKLKFKPRR